MLRITILALAVSACVKAPQASVARDEQPPPEQVPQTPLEMPPVTPVLPEETTTPLDARNPRIKTVAGIQLKIFEPASGAPTNVAVFLHGDGDSIWVHTDSGWGAIKDWPLAHDMLFVSMLAPNKKSWWSTHYSEESRTDYSAEFMQALEWVHANYTVGSKRLFYSGASGGSTFVTNFLLPGYGAKLEGVFALACGGWVHSSTSIEGVSNAGKVIRFAYGSDDEMFTEGDIPGAIKLYTDHGWSVGKKEIPDEGHCRTDLDDDIAEIWQQNHTR